MATQLQGAEIGEFSDALRNAFSPPEFQRLMTVRLRRSFWDYAPLSADYQTAIFEIIGAGNRQGWIADLIAAARAGNPGNAGIYAFAQRLELSSVGAAPLEQARERVVKQTNRFIDVTTWREKLGEIEPRVCRIEITTDQGKMIYGTGFLIGPDMCMTNYHVIDALIAGAEGKTTSDGLSAAPAAAICRFDYKRLGSRVLNPGVEYGFAQNWKVDASPDWDGENPPPEDRLDYAVMRLSASPGNEPIAPVAGATGPQRGWLKPTAQQRLAPNSPLFIMQHPQAAPLKLALDTDGVVGVNENGTRVRYKTNTEHGSSGAPCFNQDWELVALHHSGDPNFESAHKPEYNEGIPFSAISALLGKRGLSSIVS